MTVRDTDIWWHFYPLNACDGRTIAHNESWLDHVRDLGCTGLVLGPIFASVSHGYDTLNHYEIDPRLGTTDDFMHFVAQCQERGLDIVLDGVFNHVSEKHSLITEHPDWIHYVDGYPRGWEGNTDLIELNHDHPEVADMVVDIMTTWLARGIRGWRLDVAYSVPPEFWMTVIKRVRRDYPDALFLGEMIHGDYSEFVTKSGVDTVTQYELWKALWSSFHDSNPHELAHALGRHADFCQSFVPYTFISNHDVTRIRTKIGEKARLAAVALVTLPGTPAIYYGDELGFEGTKRDEAGGDDEVRPAVGDVVEGDDSYRELYRNLVTFRREHPWLTRADLIVDEVDHEKLTYTLRGERTLTVTLFYNREEFTVELDSTPIDF